MTYERQCVLCQRRLDQGHVCPACVVRIADHLDDIVRLASLASVEPRSGTGGGRSVPGSRPPLNVDAVDPALTLVNFGGGPLTILGALESWARLTLESRRMAPYGPWSAHRAAHARSAMNDTRATLVGVVGLLRSCLPWMASKPDFPIDDFAHEIALCRRALVRFDPDREPLGYAAYCPTDGCGCKLHYTEPDEQVTCPRCHVTRDVPTLVAVILSDPDCQDIWADITTAAEHYGVSERRVRQMVAEDKIQRQAGRYLISTRRAV